MQFYNIWVAKKHSSFQVGDQDDVAMKRLEAIKFKFSTIKVATNIQNNANKLREGGFPNWWEVVGNDSNVLIF